MVEWALGQALSDRVIDYPTHELCMAALRRNPDIVKSLLRDLYSKQADLAPCVPTLR